MLNQNGKQHPVSCLHVLFPFLSYVSEIFLCHADQHGMNAPQGWSMAKLDNSPNTAAWNAALTCVRPQLESLPADLEQKLTFTV